MDLLIGTNNKGKVIEIGEVLHDVPCTLITPAALNIEEDPAETGNSYYENALLKARFYFERSKVPTISDDSGIVVNALQDELGIHTRRWGAGANATDQDWIEYFLDRMKREPDKRASFICSMVYIQADGTFHHFEGRCEGTITDWLEADYLPGLPISACFVPDGYDKVFSALSIEEKNAVSHRGRAAHQLRAHLSTTLR